MTPADKRKLIENISDEVKTFHPLLENTLSKLPYVKNYEYTHGQFERGADFILELEDATTGRTRHVGVIAKIQKVMADTSHVEEQIVECAEERCYKVLQKVKLLEVWVFISGGYSSRATEKILKRYSDRSISFFGPTDIAKYVDNHYPYFWHDLPGDLGLYLQQLDNRIRLLDRATDISTSPAASDLYIDLDVYELIKKSYSHSPRVDNQIKNINIKNEILKTRIGLLEAEMGFGKSKLARHLVLSMCDAESYKSNKAVPVFSTYKEFFDLHDGNLDRLVKVQLGSAQSCLSESNIKIVIVLDGLDEYSSTTNQTKTILDELIEQANANHRYNVLVTSRPLKSLSDKAAIYTQARIFRIKPLSLAKIIRYLEQACTSYNLPIKLFSDLKRSSLFRQLPQSPIAAALFSNLLAQNQRDVPQSLTELYAKSTDLMLGRWDVKKELATEIQFTTAQQITQQIATYYIENRLIYIAKSEIEEIINSYLDKRNTGINSKEMSDLILDRSNLFVVDENSQTVAFRHRSFSEFLCARLKAKEQSLSVDSVALDPYWINVFFFYAGILTDCPSVLVELRQLNTTNETQEWMKLLSVPNYLLAAYLTEFEEVESNLLVVLIAAANLYLRVRKGDTYTRLSELPEMKLLFLFKSVVTETLGYDFFNRGFDSIALKINDCSENAEVKVYALFFLACAALECGNNEPFRFLVSEVQAKKIPLPISLAIRCELESHTNVGNSSLLKLHKEKLQKLWTNSGRSVQTQKLSNKLKLDELFKKPLSSRKENFHLS